MRTPNRPPELDDIQELVYILNSCVVLDGNYSSRELRRIADAMDKIQQDNFDKGTE